MSTTTDNTVQIYWDEQTSYTFIKTHSFSKEHSSKTVYIGHFQGTAPDKLMPDVEYCVKEIDLVKPKYVSIPQNREYFDLLDIKGEHQREILARNPNALKVAESVRTTGTYPAACTCVVVEPVYTSCAELLERCSQLSISQRLDIVMQYAQGCIELQSDKNLVCGKRIVAHRDLKIQNGVLSIQDGRYVIRLIDYASIRLEGEKVPDAPAEDAEARKEKDCTAAMPLSAANTAPEDVLRKEGYAVSEKTDVYSLGMMLAHLFVSIDSNYENPNIIWAIDHGWDPGDAELSKKNMIIAFEADESLEEQATYLNTWIEQSLKLRKHNVYWEPTADPDIQDSIRKLFFEATHINPNNRIDLRGFRSRLEEIIQKADACTARFPVSVYLFDCTNLASYKRSYLTAASLAFSKECAEARMHGMTPPLALCVCYSKPTPGQPIKDHISICTPFPLMRKEELGHYIQRLQTMSGSGQDLLIYAIAAAANYLSNRKDRYSFSGQIHLFAPSVPRYGDMFPFLIGKNHCNLEQFCNIIANDLDNMPMISVHAPSDNEMNSEDGQWYSFEALPSQFRTPTFVPPQPPVTPPPTEPPVQEPAHEQQQEAPPKPEDRFYTDSEASFFLTPDGRKIYIGLK